MIISRTPLRVSLAGGDPGIQDRNGTVNSSNMDVML